jgi:peptidoglycan/xylan/chitin deacetylase (PgdA/CDA1 family)
MYVCITFHAERLHSDGLWGRLVEYLSFFNAQAIKATFFSTAPLHPVYREQPGFSERKWIERLNRLAQGGHLIEQHTHFYDEREKKADLSYDNLRKRLEKDRHWLERHGFPIQGFVGGAWVINDEVFRLLIENGYKYDCTARSFDLQYLRGRGDHLLASQPFKILSGTNSLLEMPTTASVKKLLLSALPFASHRSYLVGGENMRFCIVYLHDYDVDRAMVGNALKLGIHWLKAKGGKFITTRELYHIWDALQLEERVLGRLSQ